MIHIHPLFALVLSDLSFWPNDARGLDQNSRTPSFRLTITGPVAVLAMILLVCECVCLYRSIVTFVATALVSSFPHVVSLLFFRSSYYLLRRYVMHMARLDLYTFHDLCFVFLCFSLSLSLHI
uniref:Secreted protein n=1 Tax=Anopheles darlingi TaxID=43151 RepID=A0A2M4DLA2_ANODA